MSFHSESRIPKTKIISTHYFIAMSQMSVDLDLVFLCFEIKLSLAFSISSKSTKKKGAEYLKLEEVIP